LNIVELRFSVIVTSITEPEAEELGATLDAEGLGETELELSTVFDEEKTSSAFHRKRRTSTNFHISLLVVHSILDF